MSFIVPTVAHNASGDAPEQTGSLHSLQWRKALEQAQWQARRRVAPRVHDNARSIQVGSTAHDVGAAPPPLTHPSTITQPAALRGAANAATASRVQAIAAAVGIAVNAASASQPEVAAPAPVVPQYGPRQAAATASPQVATSASSTQARWQALPEWPAVMVHASVQGSSVHVGVRDRAIAQGDVVDLYYRLRSQLRTAGLQLASLIVNGESATAPDNTQQPER